MQALPPLARLPLLFLGLLALVVGVVAGLARLAVDVPAWAATQAVAHGAFMVTAFLGTVISLERAVALARFWPYLAPLGAGLGGLALALGLPLLWAQALFTAAAILLLAGSVLVWRLQPLPHTATLALGAAAWLSGNLVWLLSGAMVLATPWWMAFLVLTIAGERLELTRLLPTPPRARALFTVLIALQLAGLIVSFWQPAPGIRLFALALLGLALWLLRHDLARHTVRQTGLPRYIAVCLLAGYGWLCVGGLLGAAGGFAPGHPWRDAALHAVFLGFVFSMILGHAPIILPAVARIRISHSPLLYLPLVVLHVSVLGRCAGSLLDLPALTRAAGLANAAALLLFVLTMLLLILRSRSSAPARSH
jgi:hypothetical protein